MNKFLIAFSALLAVFSVCDAYGQRLGYGISPRVIGGAAIQLAPPVSVYTAPIASGYGGQIAPGYGGQIAPGYGGQLGGYGSQLGLGSLGNLALLGGGYGTNANLAGSALALKNLPANYNQAALIQPSIYPGQASPLILPAPINSGYSIPASVPQSASAAAVAKATGNKAIPYRAGSLVAAPGALVGNRGYGPVVSTY